MISDEQIGAAVSEHLKSVKGAAGPMDLYRAAAKAGWNAAIDACRELCLEVNQDAHEAAKAKDATDYIGGYQDAAIDCDEEIRALKDG
jgi:hypothetical protein